MDINKKKSFSWSSSSSSYSDDQPLRRLDSVHFDKSYQCSFCDRGFSNAQALGGHMNIHRKDRAKLIQISEEDGDHHRSCYAYADDREQSDNAGNNSLLTHSTTNNNSSCLSRTADEGFNKLVLPISSLTHPVIDNRRPAKEGDRKSASSVDEPFPDLDLELRLGPEPAARSSSRQSFK